MPANPDQEMGSAVPVPIEEVLDLHPFHPRDIPSVVEEYIHACRAEGVALVRLVHGRGQGVQRAEVRRTLGRLPDVVSFADAAPASGGWGATVVTLRLSRRSGPP